MKWFISFFLFCIVLFFYLHIYHQLKTSNDLEVYEIDTPSKDKLEEICDIRQPVMFHYDTEINDVVNMSYIEDNYGVFDIKLRNTAQKDDKSELYLPFVFNEAMRLFKTSKSTYYSENNEDFLVETGLIKTMKNNDKFLRPPMVASCHYDAIFGGKNIITPLRYSHNYRDYYLITEGTVKMRLISPKYSKYLYGTTDYYNNEFASPINPWDVHATYKRAYSKVKSLDVSLKTGDIIYIPAYWWYSVKFETAACINVFKYRTYMNVVATLPHIARNMLQNQNVKRETIKKVITTDDVYGEKGQPAHRPLTPIAEEEPHEEKPNEHDAYIPINASTSMPAPIDAHIIDIEK